MQVCVNTLVAAAESRSETKMMRVENRFAREDSHVLLRNTSESIEVRLLYGIQKMMGAWKCRIKVKVRKLSHLVISITK